MKVFQVLGKPEENRRRNFCGMKVKAPKKVANEIARDCIAVRLAFITVFAAANASICDFKYISHSSEALRLATDNMMASMTRTDIFTIVVNGTSQAG